MWVTVLLGVLNLLMSLLGNKVVRFSGFDLSPMGMLIIAWSGENVWLGALVLTAAYGLPHPREFRYVWITLPMAVVLGYLALVVPVALPLVLFYHLVGGLSAWVFQYFSGKYVLFIMANLAVNLVALRLYSFFT